MSVVYQRSIIRFYTTRCAALSSPIIYGVHGIWIHVLPEVMHSRWLQRGLEGLTVTVSEGVLDLRRA